jgi:hypothetical protein
MDRRILKFSTDEFERAVRREVERLFELNRNSPDPSPEIPVIGQMLHRPDFDPHKSVAENAEWVELVLRALFAKKWFAESEGPPWAQPLVLAYDGCLELLNRRPPTRRGLLRAEYSMAFRNIGWEIERMPPFEIFCMDHVRTGFR